jgi:hypothetical protein
MKGVLVHVAMERLPECFHPFLLLAIYFYGPDWAGSVNFVPFATDKSCISRRHVENLGWI